MTALVQTRERANVLTELDFTPACEGPIHPLHKHTPPPATHWANIHGCYQKFACAPCIVAARRKFERRSGLRCAHCKQWFPRFTDAITVTPL
jgi:hypothetical protein